MIYRNLLSSNTVSSNDSNTNDSLQLKRNKISQEQNKKSNDSGDEAVVSKTVKRLGIGTLVPSSNIRTKLLLAHCTIEHVPGYSNCEFRAVMKGLIFLQLMDENNTVKFFRKISKGLFNQELPFFLWQRKRETKIYYCC